VTALPNLIRALDSQGLDEATKRPAAFEQLLNDIPTPVAAFARSSSGA
jgi:hypothetical protein